MEAFDELAPALSCWKHRVADVLSLSNPQLEYEYDFGDGWQHLITLEEIVAAAPGKKYPRGTAGERAGPPDDRGGPGGYESLLDVLTDPDDPEHASPHALAASQKGFRGRFDSEAFDEQQPRFANPAPPSRADSMRIGCGCLAPVRLPGRSPPGSVGKWGPGPGTVRILQSRRYRWHRGSQARR